MRKFTAAGPAYSEIKDKLFTQYSNPNFDDETGLDRESLVVGFNALAEKDGTMPRIELEVTPQRKTHHEHKLENHRRTYR